ncbi:zinc-dependent alcohol dehydrogenase [Nonomuraea lactucae]|uniref:zinc-dependent alcohol dehydrogenase n=1 Tax=Nonomuraea lactucae TaxID=2249762 RepID=UPI000DE4339A|nr:alcohol dehydrogenase catalytic domain-containing protein [Nonomuraea lactucae]
MTTMLAARANPDSLTVALEKIEIPQPGPHDVLIKVASAGLAPGMITLLAHGAFKHLPTTLGHEAAGTIAAVGADVPGLAEGERVRIHPNLTCRSCVYCRTDREQMCAQQAMIGHAGFGTGPMPLYERYHDGGLAEYIRVPYWLVDPIPDHVSFDVGAKVHDLANAVRALKTAGPLFGGTIVVTAATGTMGTATIKLAHLFGASRLILVGRSAERLEAVRRLSAIPTEAVAMEEGGDLTATLRQLAPSGVDAVVDYLPTGPGIWQATAALATGGTLVHMGGNYVPPPIPIGVIMANCWRIIGTRSCTRTDALQVLDLLDAGTLTADELITHRFPLADLGEALAVMRDRSKPIWMGVVNP